MDRSNNQAGRAAPLPPLMLPLGGGDPPPRRKRKRQRRPNGAPNPAVVEGAKAVWTRMRQLEAANVASAVPAQSEEARALEIAHAAKLLASPALRESQIRRIAEHYGDLVASVKPKSDEWRAVFKYVEGGESQFNEYLAWTDEKNAHGNDITRYCEDEDEDGDEDEDEDGDEDEDIGDYDDWDWSQFGRPERQVFALYRLLQRAPELGKPTILLHSVKDRKDMPHRPGKGDYNTPLTHHNWKPTPGQAHLSTQFVSTTVGPLNDFLVTNQDPQPLLSRFYRETSGNKGCCMCAFTVDANVRALPIFMDNHDSSMSMRWGKNWHYRYKQEMEVLLPPGLLYVFQGTRKISIVDEKASQILNEETKHRFEIFFYRVMLANT